MGDSKFHKLSEAACACMYMPEITEGLSLLCTGLSLLSPAKQMKAFTFTGSCTKTFEPDFNSLTKNAVYQNPNHLMYH